MGKPLKLEAAERLLPILTSQLPCGVVHLDRQSTLRIKAVPF
ncbi:hypothetical protein ACQCVP_00515 [Rossellomorea vietnamensis]